MPKHSNQPAGTKPDNPSAREHHPVSSGSLAGGSTIETAAFLAAIVESADDAIISKGLNGIISSWNRGAERIFGYRAEEMIGRSILTIIPPERAAEEEMIIERVTRGERVEHFETVRVRKDGSRVDISLTVSPLMDAQGRIIGASKIARDMTERNRVERALREEDQMRSTFERLQLLSDVARGFLEMGNPVKLLDRIYDRLAAAFGLDFYFHFDVEPSGKFLRLRGARGISPEVAQQIERLEFGEAGSSTVAASLKPVVPADVQASQEPFANFIRNQGITAYSCHPLIANGRLFGTLSFGSFRQTGFSPALIEMLRALSDMTATAAARRQTELALAARIRQQRTVAELGMAALRQEDAQTLFDKAGADIARTLEVELCKVLELVPGRKEMLLRAGVGWKEGLVGRATVGIGQDSQAGYTLMSSEPVIVEDLRTEARFSGPPLLHEHGVISGLSCIIVGANKQPWGVLGAHSQSPRHFTEDDVAFLQGAANVLAAFIQRKGAERQFRLVVESAPNGMVMVNEAGIILMVNSQMERLFGYERAEMLGQSIEMLLPDRYRASHPGQRQAFFHSPEVRAMGHGRDLFARRKDGSEFPVEVGLNPAETPEGTFVLAAVIDITQRKRIEHDLEKSAAQFRLVVESAPNGMVMVNEAGVILMVNSQMERLFGYERAEMLGQSIEMLLPDRYRTSHPGQRQAFFHSPEVRAMGHGRDLFARRKDGSEFPVEVGLNPAETPEGTFVLAAVIDITQRKQMEADLASAHLELERRARDLEAMVVERTMHLQHSIAELEGVSYSLSHDMRAPLRAIHSFLEIVLAEAGNKLDSAETELLQKAIRAAGRLDRLIQDVLTYSRVSRESITLSSMNVEKLLRQIIDERPEFQPPHAEIEIPAPIEPVRGHEASLTQCITNLLDNAVKFVPPDRQPRVRIWSETVGDLVRLWIEDNGIGISEGTQERVFGIFQRVHDDKRYAGTGIGLAIARKAVERMGGSIGFESTPGKGSRFWVELGRE